MSITKTYSPATGEMLGESKLHTVEDLKKAIEESRSAQKIWKKNSVRKRARIVKKVIPYLLDNLDRFATTISKENGKLKIEALAAELMSCVINSKYSCKKSPGILKERRVAGSSLAFYNYKSYLRYEPMGVVGIISPWNYPFAIAWAEVISALLAGNGVILKTASQTQQCGLAIAETIYSLDLPEGLFQFINLPGSVAGGAFLEYGVDKLFFTGSVSVGKQLMKQAAKTLTPVSLELGGNDAMIVCNDAPVELAVNGVVWAGLANAGQSCGGVERIYVLESIYEKFMNRLKEKVAELKPGHSEHMDSDIGVMTTEKQKKLVEDHIEDAVKSGATIFAQSDWSEYNDLNNAMPPTVLSDVTHEMDVMKDESFGPVVGVMKVKSIEEAVNLANNSYLGLTGSVWTKNLSKGRKIARQIEAGAVVINDHLMSHGLAETSWGGFKESGIGRTHGKLGLLEMVEPQHIVVDWQTVAKRKLWWHPYSEKLYNSLMGATHFLYGRGFRRFKGFFQLLSVAGRMFKKK